MLLDHLAAPIPAEISYERAAVGKRARRLRLVPIIARLVLTQISLQLKARLWGVRTKAIWGGALKDNEIGPAM